MRFFAKVFGIMLLSVFVWHAVPFADEAKMAATERHEIDDKFKWNTAAIFASDEVWEKELAALTKEAAVLKDYQGTLAKSSDALADYFLLRDKLLQRVEILSIYASLRSDEDTRVAKYKDMDTRAGKLYTKFAEWTAWEDPELAAIPADKLRGFLKKNKRLASYEFSIENSIRLRQYTLSPREEELLAMAGTALGAPADIAGMIRNADFKWPSIKDEDGNEVELTSGRFEKFRRSKDVRVRRDAYNAALGAYGGISNTLASALAGAVEGHIFNARARGYESSLHASLARNNIPESVYRNLIQTVGENIDPVHRYVALRKKALGLDEMHYVDLYPSIASNPPGGTPYDEGRKMVLGAVEVLGEPYVNDLNAGLDAGWVDVYENVGKRSGAYSHGTKGTMPYILMNYGDNISGVFTLAHEAGHSMHSLLTGRNQEYVNCDYSTFVAEVASTGVEALLQFKLGRESEGAGRDEQIYLLDHFIQDMMGTMIRQTMFAEFELGIHEMAERGETLTPEAMGAFYSGLVAKYYGPAMVVDPETAYTWARIPHFFYNFYVFQYATSYAASFAIAEKIDKGEPGAVDAFLNLLKEGGSDYPIEQMKRAGVDMTTPAPIEAAMRTMSDAVTRLEKLIEAS